MKYLELGDRIKYLRERAKLSIKELSERTEIPVAQIESFENDKEQPIIAHLIKLSKALQVNVADIFRHRPPKAPFEVIRKASRPPVRKSSALKTEKPLFDYAYQLLIHPSDDKHLNAYWVEFAPLSSSKSAPKADTTHEGEEFIFIVEGELEGEIGSEKIHLKEGDSIFFRSNQPHVFYNRTKTLTKALAVVYPF